MMIQNAMNLAATPEPIIARVMHSTNSSRSIGALLMDAGRITPEAAERILKLLTPTDNTNANDWRKRCWANIENRKTRKNLPDGTVLRYGDREYTIDNEGRGPVKNKTWVTDESGQPYTMKRSQILAAEIVSRPDKNG